MSKKIVVNACHGGFSLSTQAEEEYAAKKGIKLFRWNDPKYTSFEIVATVPRDEYEKAHSAAIAKKMPDYTDVNRMIFSNRDIPRDDTDLVEIVERLGDAANGRCAKLIITEIPDDVEWEIEEYDGSEWVSEAHRTW